MGSIVKVGVDGCHIGIQLEIALGDGCIRGETDYWWNGRMMGALDASVAVGRHGGGLGPRTIVTTVSKTKGPLRCKQMPLLP